MMSEQTKKPGYLSRVFSAIRGRETRDFLGDPPQWFLTSIVGRAASSGVTVNASTALGSTPVYAAIRAIAEDLSSLPLITYRRLDPRGKERARNHPLFTILHDQANPDMTAFRFWELALGNMMVNGNSINFVERNGAGQVVELWPLRPDQIQMKRNEAGDLIYRWTPGAQDPRTFQADEILHFRAFSRNGIWGMSPIDVAREAIGLTLATEEYGARFFSNDASPGGVLEHPGSLSKEAIGHVRDTFEARHSGLSGKHKMLILEEGMKWSQTTIAPENAQFLETRKFQVTEIARIFRVPPHKIADMDRATFSNIEEQNIDYVVSTIRPWARRIEQEIKARLFRPKDPFFAEFLIDGLLRGNTEARFNAYATGRNIGVYSADDIRELENLNPLPDGQGEIYLVPLNMVDARTLTETPAPRMVQIEAEAIRSRLKLTPGRYETRAAETRRRLGHAFRSVFHDAAARIIRREIKLVDRKAGHHLEMRDVGTLKANLEDFYLGEHREFVEQQIRPAVDALSKAIHDQAVEEINGKTIGDELAVAAAGLTFGISDRWVRYSNAQLVHVLSDPDLDPRDALAGRLSEWKEKRAGKFANRETVNVEGAVSRKTWQGNGVTRLRWVAFPPFCPMCAELDGRIVGIDVPFLEPNEELVGTDGETRIQTQGRTLHAPLHDGCDCSIAPE